MDRDRARTEPEIDLEDYQEPLIESVLDDTEFKRSFRPVGQNCSVLVTLCSSTDPCYTSYLTHTVLVD